MKAFAALVSANPSSGSKRVQEADEVLLFVRRQLRTEYEIEEFNRTSKGQQVPVVQIRRRCPCSTAARDTTHTVLFRVAGTGHGVPPTWLCMAYAPTTIPTIMSPIARPVTLHVVESHYPARSCKWSRHHVVASTYRAPR